MNNNSLQMFFGMGNIDVRTAYEIYPKFFFKICFFASVARASACAAQSSDRAVAPCARQV